MRASILLFLLFILPIDKPVLAQSAFESGLYSFSVEALNYSGLWTPVLEGGITRQFTDSGSAEFEVTGQTLVIQRRMCASCGVMTVDVNGVLFNIDNAAPETADYPVLIPLDTTTQTITITASGDLWLNYFMVLDAAIMALPEMTPEPDSLYVYAIEPETNYHSTAGQITGVRISLSAGELVIAAAVFALLLMGLFGLAAGEGKP